MKISALEESPTGVYLANSDRTSVYQFGQLESYVPPLPTVNPLFRDGCIDGLRGTFEKVLAALFPHVQLSEVLLADQLMPTLLLIGPAGAGKFLIGQAVARQLFLHFKQVNCYDLCADTASAAEAKIKNSICAAQNSGPCLLMLRHLEAVGKDKNGTFDTRVVASFKEQLQAACGGAQSKPDWPLVVMAAARDRRRLAPDLGDFFLHQLEIQAPTEEERLKMLNCLFSDAPLAKSVSLAHTARRTAGFVLGDLSALVSEISLAARQRLQRYCGVESGELSSEQEEELNCAEPLLLADDFSAAIETIQTSRMDKIGSAKIPDVKWEDIGGLEEAKQEILNTIQLPLTHKHLFAQGLRRSGVLLYGAPGTGKTLLAKAVATECSLNFLSVKGPELINMYVGQSEQNVRDAFTRARSARPCIIFFDELDSLAPNRGRSGDSGGVMDRVVSQLLAEMDGLDRAEDVFVIGATNRPDLLDPALLRPGRLDKLIYVGVNDTPQSRLLVLRALTRKFDLSADVDLMRIAALCPNTVTGADLYSLCCATSMRAIKRQIQLLKKDPTAPSHLQLLQSDFEAAAESLVPSLRPSDVLRYAQLQDGGR